MTAAEMKLGAQQELPMQHARWTWTGRAMSGIVAAFLLIDGGMKLVPLPIVTETLAGIGYPPELARTIGVLTVVPAVLYILPRTALLGAYYSPGCSVGRWRPIFALAARCSPISCSVRTSEFWFGAGCTSETRGSVRYCMPDIGNHIDLRLRVFGVHQRPTLGNG